MRSLHHVGYPTWWSFGIPIFFGDIALLRFCEDVSFWFMNKKSVLNSVSFWKTRIRGRFPKTYDNICHGILKRNHLVVNGSSNATTSQVPAVFRNHPRRTINPPPWDRGFDPSDVLRQLLPEYEIMAGQPTPNVPPPRNKGLIRPY